MIRCQSCSQSQHLRIGLSQDLLNLSIHLDHYLPFHRKINGHSQIFMDLSSCHCERCILGSILVHRMSSTTLGSMCEIFRSSTCHRMVHCCPFIILFAIHLSYGLRTNPHLANNYVRFFKKSRAAWSVTYNAFLNFM
jgi:hypothetical protein